MATFVLVHGAWCGGWSWQKLTPLLRAAGHDVYAPTLTGLGERVHLAGPEVDLDTHVADIVNVLRFEELWEVVLVGWSYGGTVIAGVAERVPERLAQLVYLDADVPELDWPADAPGAATADEADDGAGLAGGEDWLVPVPTDPAVQEATRAWMPDEALREWFGSKLVPHPRRTFEQSPPLGNPAAAAIPRTFVLCTEGKAAGDDNIRTAERLRDTPGWRCRELATTHVGPVTTPQLVADLLRSLV